MTDEQVIQYETPKGCRRVELDGAVYYANRHGVVFQLAPDVALGFGAVVRFATSATTRRVMDELDHAARESMPTWTVEEANAEIRAMVEEAKRNA